MKHPRRAANAAIVFCAAVLARPTFALDSKELSDRIAVEETITTLFIKTDEKDWAAVRAVFAPSVRFDMSSLSGAAPAKMTPVQITAMWENGLKPIQAIHHQAGNFRFKIEGDHAEAHCYGIAYHYRPVKSGRNTRVFVGSYDVRLTRSATDWKIESFRYNSQFVDGNLKLDSEAQ